MTKNQFRAKCEWEGGYYGLAGYGIDPKELKDKKLKELWTKYLSIYVLLEACEREMDEYLEV